jgi:hypothetical protein
MVYRPVKPVTVFTMMPRGASASIVRVEPIAGDAASTNRLVDAMSVDDVAFQISTIDPWVVPIITEPRVQLPDVVAHSRCGVFAQVERVVVAWYSLPLSTLPTFSAPE